MSQRLMRTGAAPMTGPLKIVDGSASSPAVQFSTDPTSGFYKTASGFAVSVGGVKIAEFVSGGIKGARFIGELIPFSGLTAQPLTVFPYGQTLSRTAFPDLWTFAQNEISNGNGFYNNGDGSTTFGVGDCRGRVIAGKDNMGGTAAGRLPSSGVIDGTVLGYVGGSHISTLTADQIPSINSSGAISVTSTQGGIPSSTTQLPTVNGVGGGQWGIVGPSNGSQAATIGAITSTGSNTMASTNTGGNSHNNVQPTIVGTFLLFAGA
jgi:microcystin-dependent protein